jgi:hypothetical protein
VIDKVFFDLLGPFEAERSKAITRSNGAERQRKIKAIHIKECHLLSSLADSFDIFDGQRLESHPTVDFRQRYRQHPLVRPGHLAAIGQRDILRVGSPSGSLRAGALRQGCGSPFSLQYEAVR